MRKPRDAAVGSLIVRRFRGFADLFAVPVYESGSNKIPQVIEATFIVWRCAASVAFVAME